MDDKKKIYKTLIFGRKNKSKFLWNIPSITLFDFDIYNYKVKRYIVNECNNPNKVYDKIRQDESSLLTTMDKVGWNLSFQTSRKDIIKGCTIYYVMRIFDQSKADKNYEIRKLEKIYGENAWIYA